MPFCQIVLIDIFEQNFNFFSGKFFFYLKENVKDDNKMLQIKFKSRFYFLRFSIAILLTDDWFEIHNTVKSWQVYGWKMSYSDEPNIVNSTYAIYEYLIF